jgi:hypothetical protein
MLWIDARVVAEGGREPEDQVVTRLVSQEERACDGQELAGIVNEAYAHPLDGRGRRCCCFA